MSVASRFQSRARMGSYGDRDTATTPPDTPSSSGESELNLVRRKIPRTTAESNVTAHDDHVFRKPTLPASATRTAPRGLEREPSLNNQYRRRSTLQRENVRVPSGPRDFPSPGRIRKASTTFTAPSMLENSNGPSRPSLPKSTSDSFFYDSSMATSQTALSFGDPMTGRSDSSAATTPLTEREGFLPELSFDDFQTRLLPNNGQRYESNGMPAPSDVGMRMGHRTGGHEPGRSKAHDRTNKESVQQPRPSGESDRTSSLRQRLAAGGRQASTAQQPKATEGRSFPTRSDSLRQRRQSSISMTSSTQNLPTTTVAKQPRKSVGPGMLTNMVKGNDVSQSMPSMLPPDRKAKSTIARESSFTRSNRRTTVQPLALPSAEPPRSQTFTATTQSRQNKIKSARPISRGQEEMSDTPPAPKSASKSAQNRATTPSSSGTRRQSIASGRASGLGARTVSPTDARRMRRLSTMNAPPMPTTMNMTGAASASQLDDPSQMPLNNKRLSTSRLPTLPGLTLPGPSMIPRKSSNATLNSTRALSPEGRQGGVSLSTKSSFSSLNNVTGNGSSSRLPTPRPRNGSRAGSASDQYREHFSDALERFGSFSGSDEMVPPVPAIPKAYESPRDLDDDTPFFSAVSCKTAQMGGSGSPILERNSEQPSLPAMLAAQPPRSSFETHRDTLKKRRDDRTNDRRATLANGMDVAKSTSPPSKSLAAHVEPTGRKNNNLQPLRLPPLNLMPIDTRALQGSLGSSAPRPSQEVDDRDDLASLQTPEPRRTAKTPSTPITASKATFFRRQEDTSTAIRSVSSHYALRDISGVGASQRGWDESDPEFANVAVPQTNGGNARNMITPFSSGSLPKGSGEYARQRVAQLDYHTEDEYEDLQSQQLPSKAAAPRVRAQRGANTTSSKSSFGAETPMGIESVPAERPEQSEQSLRRKLSLGWRRSSEKAANHSAEDKSSPRLQTPSDAREKTRRRDDGVRQASTGMPPPRLPASTGAAWTSDVPSLPSSGQPSMDGLTKRRSQLPASVSTSSLASGAEQNMLSGSHAKTKAQHIEQPVPVAQSLSSRNSSWSNLGTAFRFHSSKPSTPNGRQRLASSTASLNMKDKDDIIADDEMARLSRKRKDVDSSARDSEALRKRAVARPPCSAESVLHDRSLTGGSALNVFERGEVVLHEADGIYFTGAKVAKKIVGSLDASAQAASEKAGNPGTTNFGYDDERGDYNVVMGDHLAYRYEVVDVLGKGSFGQVVRCVDHKEGAVVAVKIIRNKKRFHQQALVEVGILGKLRDWDPDGAHATLSITTSFYFRSHLCIVTPCLSINLYELIRAHNFAGFPLPLVRRFARQMLSCLTLLQAKRIIHCDLKPENILLCEARKADVRVIDFGSSCREEEKVYTYIQSRFYRSPEVILGSSYGLGIDMWSLGCILAELWTGYPIFPGENEQEQLACIMEIFGPPDRHLVERCTRKKLFFDSVGKPRVTVSSKGKRRRPSSKTIQQALKSEDEAFVDFITRCLRWDPDRRIKATDAVTHPFITNAPFHQRPGVQEEARRAAKARPTVAMPANGAQAISSPGKRVAHSQGNYFTQTVGITPAKDRVRPPPETPQTAVRHNAQAVTSNSHIVHGSPAKSAANPNRRHSTITTAGAAAMAGTKRASNGALVGGGSVATNSGGFTAPNNLPSRSAGASLAQIAASAASNSAARWRT